MTDDQPLPADYDPDRAYAFVFVAGLVRAYMQQGRPRGELSQALLYLGVAMGREYHDGPVLAEIVGDIVADIEETEARDKAEVEAAEQAARRAHLRVVH